LHANRAHLAAREEGLDRGVAIVLGGAVGRRLAILRRGHAEGGWSEGRQRWKGRGSAHDDGTANVPRYRATADGAGNLGHRGRLGSRCPL